MLAQSHTAAIPFTMSQPSIDKNKPGNRKLKARARLYRRLAETLCDPQIIDVVLACADECEAQAGGLAGNAPAGLNGEGRG